MADDKPKKAPGRPFEKGKSANPGGRPKVDFELREWGREKFNEKIIVRLAQLMESKRGDVAEKAAYRLWCILNGNPAQEVAVTGAGGGPIQSETRIEVTRRELDPNRLVHIVAVLERAGALPAAGATGAPGGVIGPPAAEVHPPDADPAPGGVPKPPGA